jgi:hypothetical protein
MRKALLALVIAAAALSSCSDDSSNRDDALSDAQSGTDTADATSPDTGSDATDPDATSPDTGSDAGSDASGDAGSQDDAGDGATTDPLACPALPASTGEEVRVGPSEVADLPQIVREAATGTTIVLEDGTYALGAPLQFRTAGVTLRSASDDATKVVLDADYNVTEPFYIVASDVTVAHVTIKRAIDHPVHITPGGGSTDVTGTLLYGLRIIDGGEQFVKVNPNGARTHWVDDGRIECSYFAMTDAGRPNVERSPGGCYTGGVDVHSGRGWVVRNNEFRDIYCAGEGLAEHAIHFWSASRDTLVENNLIVNCARGVGFGLVENGGTRPYADDPYPNAGYVGHYDGIIRNNVVYADNPWFDTGIELAQARGARVFHNTIFSTNAATGFYSSIDYRFSNTDAEIRNNLVNRITRRNDAQGQVDHNEEGIDASFFVDAANLDFHLSGDATAAIDQGVVVDAAGVDLDGEPHDRGAGPDLGADETQ